MLSTLFAVAVIVAASLIAGAAAARAFGASRWSWTSTAVGFSVLMATLAPAAYLPGRMIIPLVIVAVLLTAGIRLMVREPDHRPPLADLAALVPTILAVGLPFLANGRVGVLGVNFNNDNAAHLWLSEAMHSGSVASVTGLLEHYPLGPHALIGAVTTAGFSADLVLAGLIVAAPILTAATAQALLPNTAWWLRAPVILLTALPYLTASYVAQGAFKEVIIAFLLVGFAAALVDAAARTDTPRFLSAATILTGIVSTYSYVGLAWAVAGLGLIGAVWTIAKYREGRLPAIGGGVAALVAPVTGAFLLAVALLTPQLTRVQAFYDWNASMGIKADDLGNLAGPISRLEMLGVWWTSDFRFSPPDLDISHAGAAVVGVLLAGSVIWWLRRGLVQVPLVALGALVIATVAAGDQSPYTVAKAYVIVSPFVFLLIGRAVTEGGLGLRLAPRAGVVVAASAAAMLALWSTGLALRGAQVGPRDHSTDLSALRSSIHGGKTLYLGLNDFLTWELRGRNVTQPLYGVAAFEPRPEKGWQYGQSFDVDTVPTAVLDTYDYVITPRIRSASAMPSNFRKVATSGVYELFRRTGPTPQRQLLAEGQDGAARLDCSTTEGRRLSRLDGVAAVRGAQVRVPLEQINPRGELRTQLRLSAGVWDLSLRYVSGRPITLTAPGFRTTLPASLERSGSVWPAGEIRVGETSELPLVFKPEYRPFGVDASTLILPTELIAQRRAPERLVPLEDACGRFVDWYRTTPAAADTTKEPRRSEG